LFTADQRDRVRERLLGLAEDDPDVVGTAIMGSYTTGGGDEWSDVDLAFGVRGELRPALERWAGILVRDFGALHHWDLPWGSYVYRVFLLPDWLEVDIAFMPEADFGPRAPTWLTVFGEPVELRDAPVPADDLVGLAWHHALHARACIERGKPWQAEWLISGLRDHVLALACGRLGLRTRFAKGADELPPEVRAPLVEALVSSLDAAELRRAFAAATAAYAAELDRVDPPLAVRLRPMLAELVEPVP
jgi:predicted nucleotidyltransferase